MTENHFLADRAAGELNGLVNGELAEPARIAAAGKARLSELSARPEPRIVTLDEFIEREEPGADALLGDAHSALIPEGGDVMFYGDGGAGKTTLSIDLACHLASGAQWLGIPVARQVRVLLIENEGPRPLFRTKLRRKREAWSGPPLDDRIGVLEQPWGCFNFGDEAWREKIATEVCLREVDVLFVGPITRAGMNDAGTLQEVRDFMWLVAQLRDQSRRRLTVILIHHQNKGGRVSGAWEGAGDTLFHVQAQGNGRTRLYVQKARWSSEYHGKALNLFWTPGESFAIGDKPELADGKIEEQILAVVRANPGTSWSKIEKLVSGRGERTREIRDLLLRDGRIVNAGRGENGAPAVDHCAERMSSRLYLAEDPEVAHLRPSPDAGRTQSVSKGGHLRPSPDAGGTQSAISTSDEGEALDLRPASLAKGTQGVGAQLSLTDEESG